MIFGMIDQVPCIKQLISPLTQISLCSIARRVIQEKNLDVVEMRMIRYMSGVTKLDTIRNERISEGGRNIQENTGK